MTEEQSKNKPEALLRHLSAEDLELVNTSDDELWKRSSVFSFDLQECQARVTRGEKWHQLIQAHLYLEHVLTMLMTDALADPGAIGASRMAFAQKLNMIRAMGLLSVENVSTLIKINKLRNKIAHDLTFSITDESERDLINATSDNFKASVMSDDK